MAQDVTDKTPLEMVLQIAGAVEHKSGQRSNGKGEWNIWKVRFIGQPETVDCAETWEKPGADVLLKLAETQAKAAYVLIPDKQHNGKITYSIEKIASEDGKTVLYQKASRDGRPRSTGGPEWSYRTPAERHEERLSIEAQKSLEYAIRTLEATIQYDTSLTPDKAVQFVSATALKFHRDVIRKTVTERFQENPSQSLKRPT